MKYCVLFLLYFLFSCRTPTSPWYEINNQEDLSNYSEKEIFSYTLINIKHEYYAWGYVPAQNTWDTKKGNCCNKALVAAALIYKYKNKKVDLYEVSYCNIYYMDHVTISIDSNYKKLWRVIRFDEIENYIKIYGVRL